MRSCRPFSNVSPIPLISSQVVCGLNTWPPWYGLEERARRDGPKPLPRLVPRVYCICLALLWSALDVLILSNSSSRLVQDLSARSYRSMSTSNVDYSRLSEGSSTSHLLREAKTELEDLALGGGYVRSVATSLERHI